MRRYHRLEEYKGIIKCNGSWNRKRTLDDKLIKIWIKSVQFSYCTNYFLSCNKYTTVIQDANSREYWVRGIQKPSIVSSQLPVNLKLFQVKSLFKKRQWQIYAVYKKQLNETKGLKKCTKKQSTNCWFYQYQP
jgi:hypothetical protein